MKEFTNKFKKNKKLYVALASLALIGVVGSTIAYLYMKKEFENRFYTSSYNVAIKEEFYDEWGTKKVSVVNQDATPVVIRVAYIETWSDKNDEDVSLQFSNQINGIDVVTKSWTNSWTNEFIPNSDGWYYYNKVLTKDETVRILESIKINKDVTKTSEDNYSLYDYDLDFRYEAIQATENAISELWGHNATISGGEVSWDF